MNFFKSLVCLLVLILLFPGFTSAGNADFIPLNKGNWWLYKVTYAVLDMGVVDKGVYTEKIEVLKVARYKDVTVALFSNIPGGLYREKEKATLFVADNKDYYWTDEEVFDLVVKNDGKIKIEDLGDKTWGDFGDEPSGGKIKWLELSLPLAKNKLFGCDERDKSRGDNRYCNWVRSIKPAKQKYFPGKDEYEIAEYTLPDESHSYYVEGAGLTYYSYSHHGSLNEQRWNLQRYFISTK